MRLLVQEAFFMEKELIIVSFLQHSTNNLQKISRVFPKFLELTKLSLNQKSISKIKQFILYYYFTIYLYC